MLTVLKTSTTKNRATTTKLFGKNSNLNNHVQFLEKLGHRSDRNSEALDEEDELLGLEIVEGRVHQHPGLKKCWVGHRSITHVGSINCEGLNAEKVS